jgi:hypothetical protein
MKTVNTRLTKFSTARTSRRKFFKILPIRFVPIAFVVMTYSGNASAFSGNWSYSWGDTKYSYADMGTINNRTCFLSGVTGDLSPPALSAGGGQPGVGVGILKNRYILFVDPSNSGGKLGAYARCVNTAAGLTKEASWNSILNKSKVQLAPPDLSHPYRRCFLTSITVSNQAGVRAGFSSNTDNVQISYDTKDGWRIGGAPKSGYVVAKARCIDVNHDVGSWASYGTQKLTTDASATCFLTGIQGQFIFDDWLDGAFVDYRPTDGAFFMNIKNGKRAWSTCVN